MRFGFRPGGFRSGRPRLDRGRRQGAVWWFVDPKRNLIPYTQELAAQRKKGDGWTFFRSGREAKRWLHLLIAQDAGMIRDLNRQVPFVLFVVRPDGLKEQIGKYLADFVYDERTPAENHARVEWTPVVEDAKGHVEDLYKWKRAHLKIQYGIIIREV